MNLPICYNCLPICKPFICNNDIVLTLCFTKTTVCCAVISQKKFRVFSLYNLLSNYISTTSARQILFLKDEYIFRFRFHSGLILQLIFGVA